MGQIKRRIAIYFIPMQLSDYQMFSPPPSPTLNWKRYSSLKTNNFEKPRLIP